MENRGHRRTAIFLAEDLRECHGMLDTCLPCLALESEEGLFAALRDWRQLKEISRHDKLVQR